METPPSAKKKGTGSKTAYPLVGGTELEAIDANGLHVNDLRQSKHSEHAQSYAVHDTTSTTDDQQAAELAVLAMAWPKLSDRTRRRILGIVQSCDRKRPNKEGNR